MMILDTNVISELMRGRDADANVEQFLTTCDEPLFSTTITRAEIMAGIAVLPEGQRKRSFYSLAARALHRTPMLGFDARAADVYGFIYASRRSQGKPISSFDGAIAAISKAHDAALVTRNVKDLEGLGLRLINPWLGPSAFLLTARSG